MGHASTGFLRRRSGGATVFTVVFLVVLVGILGLTIDVGRAYVEHSRMRNFVDAAAAAAALELDGADDSLDRARAVLQSETLASSAIYSEGGGNFVITPVFLSGPPRRLADGTLDVAGLETTVAQDATHLLAIGGQRQVGWSLLSLLQGAGSFPVSASAVATVSRTSARSLELTFAIDNSPSMLIGATPGDIERMRAATNCAFACHYDEADVPTFFDNLRTIGHEVRLHAAIDSIKSTLQLAKDTPLRGDAAIYFDVNTFARDLQAVVGAKGDAALIAEASIDSITPAPEPATNRFEVTDPRAFADLAQVVRDKITLGPDRDQAIVILTDGVADYRDGSRVIRAFTEADCSDLQALGVTIGVIYTTYLPLPENGFWRNNVDPFDEEIRPNLEACATPGLFFEAAFSDDIDAAFKELLRRQLTVNGARLTD